MTCPQRSSQCINEAQRRHKRGQQYAEHVPDVTFLFGGYDWWAKCFRIWRIEFDEATSQFGSDERTGSNKFGGLGKIEIAGDTEWADAMRDKLKKLAQSRYGLDMRQPDTAKFDLEPFEVPGPTEGRKR